MRKLLLLLVLALTLITAPAMANEGFYIGAFIPSEKISGDAGAGIGSGNGWGARAGFGFNRYFSIEANYATTKHDVSLMPGTSSTDLNSVAGDIKLSFPLTSLDRAEVMTLVPYVLAGYAHYEQKSPSTFKSDGAQWGFGIELYLFRELSVAAGWTKTSISFKNVPSGLVALPFIDKNGAVTRVDFGLIYHFL